MRVSWPDRDLIKHCHVVEAGKCLGFIALESLVFLRERNVDMQNTSNYRRHEGTRKILGIEESEKKGWPNEINMRREKGGS